MSPRVRRLGELEAEVMDRLWAWGRPATVREVVDDLQQSRNIAYTTVLTVLDNLYHKGLVARGLSGRAYSYQPMKSREEFTADLIDEAMSDSDDRAAVLVRFVERLTPAETRQLREALRQRDRPDTNR